MEFTPLNLQMAKTIHAKQTDWLMDLVLAKTDLKECATKLTKKSENMLKTGSKTKREKATH